MENEGKKESTGGECSTGTLTPKVFEGLIDLNLTLREGNPICNKEKVIGVPSRQSLPVDIESQGVQEVTSMVDT
ncbi:hypothetical protein ACFX1R_042428 [Malus domestica]